MAGKFDFIQSVSLIAVYVPVERITLSYSSNFLDHALMSFGGTNVLKHEAVQRNTCIIPPLMVSFY